MSFDYSTSVSDQEVLSAQDLTAAILLSITISRKQHKVVAIELGIDQAQFSRILSRSAYFPTDKFLRLCEITGNDIPLRWLALKRGYGLIRLKHLLEAENEELRSKVAELEEKLKSFEEFAKNLNRSKKIGK